MIKEKTSLGIAESTEYFGDNKELKGFVKKFSKMKPKEAKEMRKELEDLDILKLDEFSVSKIIDVLPKTVEDVNKVVRGIGLDEEEIKKVLEVVKKHG